MLVRYIGGPEAADDDGRGLSPSRMMAAVAFTALANAAPIRSAFDDMLVSSRRAGKCAHTQLPPGKRLRAFAHDGAGAKIARSLRSCDKRLASDFAHPAGIVHQPCFGARGLAQARRCSTLSIEPA
jgi:hypothetical protein